MVGGLGGTCHIGRMSSWGWAVFSAFSVLPYKGSMALPMMPAPVAMLILKLVFKLKSKHRDRSKSRGNCLGLWPISTICAASVSMPLASPRSDTETWVAVTAAAVSVPLL